MCRQPRRRLPWSGGNNNYGISLSVGQFDDDGVPDLLIGAWQGEVATEDAVENTGIVAVHRGQANAWPEVEPTQEFAGLSGGERFGSAAAFLGDANGDGSPDLMVMASDNSDFGIRVGRPYLVDGDGGLTGLDLPGLAAGHLFGRSVAQIDLNGDGNDSVLVSAPRQPFAPNSELRRGVCL